MIFHLCLGFSFAPQLEKELDEIKRFGEDIVKWNESITLYEMPNLAWDRKYYRKSFTQGLEVFLVKRIAGNRWVVLLPDLPFGAMSLTARSTIGSELGEGIQLLSSILKWLILGPRKLDPKIKHL